MTHRAHAYACTRLHADGTFTCRCKCGHETAAHATRTAAQLDVVEHIERGNENGEAPADHPRPELPASTHTAGLAQ